MAVTRAVEEVEDARKSLGGAESSADPTASEGGDDEKMFPAASMEKRG